MDDHHDQYDTGNRAPFRWETAISWKTKDEIYCRGYDVNELAEHSSFVGVVFLLLRGALSSSNEEAMLNYLMTAFAEHAFSPSAVSARMVASGRPPLNSAIAAGIMTFGEAHGPGHIYSKMICDLHQRAAAKGLSFRDVARSYVEEALKRV
ncbi:citrate/2-methylcitrate synthase [Rhodovulum sulfidophilum]|uniref:citrate/2-methylcitrate synthase n=1 Tax=Rhodovulum sulfidophilum TaxID=35806 RepID=UPI001922A060|nr:citrate/2-methylcitrate synthase [Rhodovulum sulfidophilum]MBL3561598.1 hypothetical protein [Rhodovulum sulfidophilum]